MTTVVWIIVDYAVTLLGAVAWFAAAVTMVVRRPRIALVLMAVALLVTVARAVPVVVLAGRGWWFVQEKVVLGLPMAAVAALAAALVAGPRLRAPATGARSWEATDTAGVVAQFTAAYAAVAAFVLTLLIGYPLTLDTALITVAAVVAAALLTTRVLPSPKVTEPAATGMSRRGFLGVAGGVVVVGAAGTGGVLAATRPAAMTTDGGGPAAMTGSAVAVTDLRGATTPAPGGVRRPYVLTARKAVVRLDSGREFDALTFDGSVPGPPITVTQGDLLEVTLINHDIDGGVTLHWHGYDVRCGEDGVPGVTQEAVAPGGRFVYRFRADQTGTYWYHTHYESYTGVQRGLYGHFVVKPREDIEQVDLTLSVHTFDGVPEISGGAEHVVPAGAPVRLRLLNTDSDPHRFALVGMSFRVVAVDGRDLVRPGVISERGLRLAAARRYDVVFEMPGGPVALVLDDSAATVWLRPKANAHGGSVSTPDTAGWPELDLLTYGAPARVALPTDAADRHFTMVLDRELAMVDGTPMYAHTVNGKGYPSIPDQLVTEGDVVRFTLVNRSLASHPWHLHGHAVLVLSKNGQRYSGSPVWVDIVDVGPGDVWEVAFRASNPGIWMNHCHNLPHVMQGMMLMLRYEGVTSPFKAMEMSG
ncbi:multicopper oxidase family protein [Labedaea rhizosphaerae]|uniref:Copper-containing nitrite reductase n=1 Tax=Labedaea rhizosphaerae TaxID=598644 RepID=A0A4R6S168_LABRH|nr:multicopper oxidase family protein [Labedaea rhizosphaerae]TDP92973.1 FtsP/CotA-like multicopper oxidase with cupredoxin domain [Labedaea rhizosphaerae]